MGEPVRHIRGLLHETISQRYGSYLPANHRKIRGFLAGGVAIALR
jgi:hypothetical protein